MCANAKGQAAAAFAQIDTLYIVIEVGGAEGGGGGGGGAMERGQQHN